MLDLVTDICRRNGKTKLLWFGDKDKTLAYTPKANEMVMTVHRWFANKSCPGEYLYSRHGQIAEEVNKRLSGKEEEEMTQTEFNEKFKIAMNEYRKSLQDNDCGEWSAEAREWAIRVSLFAGNGTTVDGQPNMMWADPLTREQAAVLFYRFAKEHGLA